MGWGNNKTNKQMETAARWWWINSIILWLWRQYSFYGFHLLSLRVFFLTWLVDIKKTCVNNIDLFNLKAQFDVEFPNQSLAGSPPVTHPLNIIVLLSFVWISKSLDVQQWSQMIHLDHALIKAVIWDTFVFCLSGQCHEPKHDRGSFRHIWYSPDSKLGSERREYIEIWVNLLSMQPRRASSLSSHFRWNNKVCCWR